MFCSQWILHLGSLTLNISGTWGSALCVDIPSSLLSGMPVAPLWGTTQERDRRGAASGPTGTGAKPRRAHTARAAHTHAERAERAGRGALWRAQ